MVDVLKCHCGLNKGHQRAITRAHRLVTDRDLENLGEPMRATRQVVLELEARAPQLPGHEVYEYYRCAVNTLKQECRDTVVICPNCGRLWLFRDGAQDGQSFLPEPRADGATGG